MEEILIQIKEILAIYGIRIIAALAIFIIGRWVSKGIRNLLRRMMTRSNVDKTLISFVCNLSYVALLAFVIIAALSKLGIQTTRSLPSWALQVWPSALRSGAHCPILQQVSC